MSLHIPAAQSLKTKRMVLKSFKERIRNKFNVSVVELDGQDKWQAAVLGIVMIGNDQRVLDASLQSVLLFVGEANGCDLCEHWIEFL